MPLPLNFSFWSIIKDISGVITTTIHPFTPKVNNMFIHRISVPLTKQIIE